MSEKKDKYDLAWEAVARSEHGQAIIEGLRGVYDMPLMEETARLTDYRIGQRDLAQELLQRMGAL